MKKRRKALSLIMALMMIMALVVALPLTASAAGTGSITVSPPSSGSLALAADDFEVYKVFDLSYMEGPPESYAYTPVADYSGFTPTDPDAKIVWIWMNADSRTDAPTGLGGTLDAAMVTLSKELWKFIESNGIDPVTTASKTLSGDNVKISGLDSGYYLVSGGGNATGNNPATVGSVCILISVTDGNDSEMALKADAPTIKKWVYDPDETGTPFDPNIIRNADYVKTTGWVKWTDQAIGDNVWFKLDSAVPDMMGYDTYTYTVHDKMQPGLLFNSSSVKVYIDGAEKTSGYTVSLNPTDGCTFDIAFDPSDFVTLTKGAKIEIIYSAKLDFDNALIYTNHNDNTVYLEYSNNPKTGHEDETGNTPEDTVWVYTYSFDVFKYTGDLANSPTALPGAEFVLITNKPDYPPGVDVEDPGTWLPGVPITFTYNAVTGVYRYDPDSANYTLTSGDDGMIKVEGLDEGTYFLMETKAPEGYNRLPNDATLGVGIYNFVGDRMALDTDQTDKMTLNGDAPNVIGIENNAGTVFPSTGGIGRTIFIVIGLTVMAGAAVTLIVRRKVTDK